MASNSTGNSTVPSDSEASVESPFATDVRYWLYVSSGLVYGVQLPVSLVSALTVCASSVLHLNLKLVLLSQSANFVLLSVFWIYQVVFVFVAGPNGWVNNKVPEVAILFSPFCTNLIGHALLLERILATVYAKSYEHSRKLWFPLCWLPTVFIVAFLNAYFETYQSDKADSSLDVTTGTMLMMSVSLALSFIEILILLKIGIYNRKVYFQQQYAKSLTERYQLSENIRTVRQLGPTFMLHFAHILCVTGFLASVYYSLVANIFMSFAVLYWLLAPLNVLIEISVIYCHPILRRSVRARLPKWMVAGTAKVEGENALQQRTAPRTIEGHELVRNPAADEHFKALIESWK